VSAKKKTVLRYNKNIYSSEIIVAVAHYFIGKCSVFIDESTDKFIVELIVENGHIDELIREFNEEIINYHFYYQSMKNKHKIREAILQRVLMLTEKNMRNN